MNWYLEVLKKYATFSGRAQRAEYWFFILISTLITIVLSLIDFSFDMYSVEAEIGVLSAIYGLAMIIPSIAVSFRRLHDIGKSAWWLLLLFIPLIGVIVIFIFMVLDSKDDNIYGVNPKKRKIEFNDDSITRLERLSELKEKGIISQDEFDMKKKEILG